MITGFVDANLEPHIPLFVDDSTGQTHSFDAVIDSGYTGYLTFPPALVASLGLPWTHQDQVVLADGTPRWLNIHTAAIIWDTQSRTVRVTAVGSRPLVGMKLLEGHEVRMRVVPGGLVWIDRVP